MYRAGENTLLGDFCSTTQQMLPFSCTDLIPQQSPIHISWRTGVEEEPTAQWRHNAVQVLSCLNDLCFLSHPTIPYTATH